LSEDDTKTRTDSWPGFARWFLVIAYGVGSPAFGIAEAMTGLFSDRFNYPSEFLYLVSALQFSCAVLLLLGRFRILSLAILTVMSLGAIYSHFRIGSPLTALPSLVFTGIQISYALHVYRHDQ